jgi:hypothetical protein
MTIGPVRASRLPVARRCAPRGASRPSSDAPPGCFESVSTTDFRSRALVVKTPSSEAARRAPWVNPPAFRFEIRRDRGSSPSFAVDAGPPRGHPASDGCVLDGTSPASGQGASRSRSRAAREAQELFRLPVALPLVPSGAISPVKERNAGAFLSATFDLGSTGRTSMRPVLSRSRRLPPGKARQAPSRGPPFAPLPLADGRGCRTCSSMFEDFD